DDVLRFTAMLLSEVVDELGTPDDFIGHPGGDNFIIVTSEAVAPSIKQRLKSRFAEEVLTHYNFIDRQQGYMVAPNKDGILEKVPFMTLAIGILPSTGYTFTDIREITEMAAEMRRQDAGTPAPNA
ncbi:MAG: response regulator, partial [Anaerolineales bacterium]